jgi:hypothetical protein
MPVTGVKIAVIFMPLLFEFDCVRVTHLTAFISVVMTELMDAALLTIICNQPDRWSGRNKTTFLCFCLEMKMALHISQSHLN